MRLFLNANTIGGGSLGTRSWFIGGDEGTLVLNNPSCRQTNDSLEGRHVRTLEAGWHVANLVSKGTIPPISRRGRKPESGVFRFVGKYFEIMVGSSSKLRFFRRFCWTGTFCQLMAMCYVPMCSIALKTKPAEGNLLPILAQNWKTIVIHQPCGGWHCYLYYSGFCIAYSPWASSLLRPHRHPPFHPETIPRMSRRQQRACPAWERK